MKYNKLISEALLFLAALALIVSGACASANVTASSNDTASADRDVLFQVSTIDALMQGAFEGFYSMKDLREHGDFGIGTFDSLDGEMIALDGYYYQVRSDGVAYPVNDSMVVPFAAVTWFEPDRNATIEEAGNASELFKQLDRDLPSENIFYALRIDGTFPYVKVRSVPAQVKPYPNLTVAAKNQSVFELYNVTGTIVGIRAPELAKGVNVVGYHLHFITADRLAGGHVLDLNVSGAVAEIDDTAGFAMQLPTSGAFYGLDLTEDLEAELKKVEK